MAKDQASRRKSSDGMKNLAVDVVGHAVEANLPPLTLLIDPGEEIEIVSLSVIGNTTDQAMLESMTVNRLEVHLHHHHLRMTEGEQIITMTTENKVRIGKKSDRMTEGKSSSQPHLRQVVEAHHSLIHPPIQINPLHHSTEQATYLCFNKY